MSEVVRVQRACPFLGLADDPETSQAFPSIWNCCHRARPIASVHLRHQREFCQTDRHMECPVFQGRQGEPLPEQLRGSHNPVISPRSIKWKRLAIPLIAGISLAILALGLFNRNSPPNAARTAAGTSGDQFTFTPTAAPGFNSTVAVPSRTRSGGGYFIGGITASPTRTVTFTMTRTPTLTNTSTRTPSLTHTPTSSRTPTSTPTATVTRTPTLTSRPSAHQLEMVIGTDWKFLLHKVRGGETFNQYAEKFNTSVEAVMAVNHDLRSPLWIDTVVVIPVGFTDVSGLPGFEPYLITDPMLSIDSLADELNVESSDLMLYNGMTEGEILYQGDWLLIPRADPESE